MGFGILAILFTIGIVQFCCKYKCKSCKNCCKKKGKWYGELNYTKSQTPLVALSYADMFGFMLRLRTFPLKGPYRYYYMSLSFVDIGHSFPKISCLFTFGSYSINVTEKYLKVCAVWVKKNFCVKILLLANIWTSKAALVRNYFSRRNVPLNSSRLPPLSLSVSFNQINAEVLFRRWITYNKQLLRCFNMIGSEWGLKMRSEIY